MSEEQIVFSSWLSSVGTNCTQKCAEEKQNKAYSCYFMIKKTQTGFSKGLRERDAETVSSQDEEAWQHGEEEQMGLFTPNFWGKCKPRDTGFKRMMKKQSPKTKMKSSLELKRVSPWMSQVWLLVPWIQVIRWKPSQILQGEHCLPKPMWPGWRRAGRKVHWWEAQGGNSIVTTSWAAKREQCLMAGWRQSVQVGSYSVDGRMTLSRMPLGGVWGGGRTKGWCCGAVFRNMGIWATVALVFEMWRWPSTIF